MENFIETSIDELVNFLRKNGKTKISDAAEFLKMNQKQMEPLLGVLEEKGIIDIKYPVIGEPQVVVKSSINEKIKINAEELKDIEKSEVVIDIERSGLKDRIKSEIKKEENQSINRKLERIEGQINELSSNVETSVFKENLAEILLIIAGLRDIEKISFYLKEVMLLVHRMKDKRAWTKEDKELVTVMLKGIAQNWRDYREEQIADLFDEMRKKIETV
jgi:hypothetical protein